MATSVRFWLSNDPIECGVIDIKTNFISIPKRIVDIDVVHDVTNTRQSVITRVVI